VQAGKTPFREPPTRFLAFEVTMFTPEIPLWRSPRVAPLPVSRHSTVTTIEEWLNV
jgi:hypothetical protein